VAAPPSRAGGDRCNALHPHGHHSVVALASWPQLQRDRCHTIDRDRRRLTQTEAAVETQRPAGQPEAATAPRRRTRPPVASDTQTPEPSPTTRRGDALHATGEPGGAPTSSRTARPRPWPTSDGRSVTTTPATGSSALLGRFHGVSGAPDLTRVEYAVGAPWIYFTLFVEGLPPRAAPRLRHRNRHGQGRRGDWLIAGDARRLDVDDDRRAGLPRYEQRRRRLPTDAHDAPVTSEPATMSWSSTKATARIPTRLDPPGAQRRRRDRDRHQEQLDRSIRGVLVGGWTMRASRIQPGGLPRPLQPGRSRVARQRQQQLPAQGRLQVDSTCRWVQASHRGRRSRVCPFRRRHPVPSVDF